MSFSLSYSSVPLEIISSALISGESNRWEYTVRIVELKQVTMDFEDYNFDLEFKAFNGWEATNTATSALALSDGNPANLPSGFTFDPLPNGLVTWGHAQMFSDATPTAAPDETGYFLICAINPVGGTCS